MRPLEGITVVTLEHAIAAPFCTRQLADLGARVIKIERPGVGDFARADVLVQNLGSEAAARLGLSFEALQPMHPRLIVCDISGYGDAGPCRDMIASNPLRSAARDALHGLIVEAFAELSAEQVVARLEAAQIANARVNTMQEVWDHPQLAARSRWVRVDMPAGPVPALLPPGAQPEAAPGAGARMDPVPALGEHTDRVLAERGLCALEIERLRADGAI